MLNNEEKKYSEYDVFWAIDNYIKYLNANNIPFSDARLFINIDKYMDEFKKKEINKEEEV